MSDRLWYLKRCQLFERLSEQQVARIEACSRSQTFNARSPIYLPAERADSVFLLARGLAKVSHLTPDGRESILTFVEPGEMFGELALFDGERRDEFVEAVEPSTVVMIPAQEMHALMSEATDVAFGVTKMIGLRRQRIERRLRNLLFLPNRDRVVHLLLDLAEQFGIETEEGIRIRVRLSHQDLANLIGSTRETVTVILGQLKSEGSVSGGRKKIILTAPRKLAASVNRDTIRTPEVVPEFSPGLAFGGI